MCASRCGVVATVEDGRFAKVTADPDHPNGCICLKGAAAPEIVYSPDRLKQPMRRTRPKGDPDPGWEPISWDDAFRLIADRLTDIKAADGAEAVVFGCATTAGSATDDLNPWLDRLAGAFGSPNFLGPGHVCTWSRLYGAKFTYGVGAPRIDLEHSNGILLWGVNPEATDPAAAIRIVAARKRGAKLIVIDPREHTLARKADCWLRVRPGSDGALALAMIHVLFDENLYDAAFVRDWTNGPFLIRDDTGALLSAADMEDAAEAPDSADSEKPGGYVVWDGLRNGPVSWRHADGYGGETVAPELSGRYDCALADGSLVSCRPVIDRLREIAAHYAPEKSAGITWVAAADVRKAARLFATKTPSGYESWTGTEMHSAAMQMNRAIHCFYGLTGQFDTRGSNVVFATTAMQPVAGAAFLPDEKRNLRLGLSDHPLGPPRDPGHVQHANVYRAILERKPYPVRAMVLFGTNVLVGHVDPAGARRALEALEFYVHVDFFDNPGTAYADLLLPASTTWESEAVRSSFRGDATTARWSQFKPAIVAPQHESRPDLDIVFALARHLGLGEDFFDGDIEAAWNHHLAPGGQTVARLRTHPAGIEADIETRYRKFAETDPDTCQPRGFATPSGRLEFYATEFHAAGYAPLPEYTEPVDTPLRGPLLDDGALDDSASGVSAPNDGDQTYPLVLTNFRPVQFIGPQNRNIPRLRSKLRDPFMELHPDTAAAAGIEDGDWAVLENRHARVRLKAKYKASLHPRVVCAPYGWWQDCQELDLPGHDPLAADGANVNLLIAAENIDPISASIPHRSGLCRVAALAHSDGGR